MDRTVPAGAACLLDFIRATKVGTEERRDYDVIYGFNRKHPSNLVTSMTADEIISAQSRWTRRFGSSAKRAGGISAVWANAMRNSPDMKGVQDWLYTLPGAEVPKVSKAEVVGGPKQTATPAGAAKQ